MELWRGTRLVEQASIVHVTSTEISISTRCNGPLAESSSPLRSVIRLLEERTSESSLGLIRFRQIIRHCRETEGEGEADSSAEWGA